MGGEVGTGRQSNVDERRRRLVIAALYLAYASFYLCRANVDASLPLLSAAYGYDKDSLGRLASLVGGAIVLDVGAGRAAGTAAGLVDAGGYVGASLGGVLLGTLAQRRGWSAAFDALAFAALLACLVATWWGLGLARFPSREAASRETA
jgi:sugar phosphate permease